MPPADLQVGGIELTGAFFWISPQHKTESDLSYGDNLHHDCTCIVVKGLVKQAPMLRFWMNALSWRTFFVWLFCFEGPKHKIWVIHTFETPASLHVLVQTFNCGSDRNILSGSELRKRNLAIEVFRSQWPTQCALHVGHSWFSSVLPTGPKDFKSSARFFFLNGQILRVGGKFKNAKRKIHFYFYS